MSLPSNSWTSGQDIVMRHGFYDVSDGITSSPFLIGVAGGTASGKSSVCECIMEGLEYNQKRKVAIVNQDAFYRDLTVNEKNKAFRGDFNFDHPDSFDLPLLLQTLTALKNGQPVQLPKYDFRSHSRVSEFLDVQPVDVILVEGILIFYLTEIRDLFNLKLFVDTDPDIRLARRVLRDITERGRDLKNVLHQYMTLVKPAYEEFCLPTKKYADVIIPRGAENEVAIRLIVQHVKELLKTPRSSP